MHYCYTFLTYVYSRFGSAVLKAYLPSPSTAVGSAPARISITTIGKCPCLVAQCNGVELSVPPNLSTTAP